MTMRTRSRTSAAAAAAAAGSPIADNTNEQYEQDTAPPSDSAVSAGSSSQAMQFDAGTRAMIGQVHAESRLAQATVAQAMQASEAKEEKEDESKEQSEGSSGGARRPVSRRTYRRPASRSGTYTVQTGRSIASRVAYPLPAEPRARGRIPARRAPPATARRPPYPSLDGYDSALDEDYVGGEGREVDIEDESSESFVSDEDEKEMYDDARQFVTLSSGLLGPNQPHSHTEEGAASYSAAATDWHDGSAREMWTGLMGQQHQHHHHHHHHEHQHVHVHDAQRAAAAAAAAQANRINRANIRERMVKRVSPPKAKKGKAKKGKRKRSSEAAAAKEEEQLAALLSQLDGPPSVPPMTCLELDSLFRLSTRSHVSTPSVSSSSSDSTADVPVEVLDFNETQLSPFLSLFSDVRSLGASFLRFTHSSSSSSSSSPMSPSAASASSAMVDVEQLLKLQSTHFADSQVVSGAIDRIVTPLLTFVDEWLAGQLPEPPTLIIDDTDAEETQRAGKKRKGAARTMSMVSWLQLMDAGIDLTTGGDVVLRSGDAESSPTGGMIDLTDEVDAGQERKESAAGAEGGAMQLEETKVKGEEEQKGKDERVNVAEDEDRPIKLEGRSRAAQFIINYHDALSSSSASSSSSTSSPSASSFSSSEPPSFSASQPPSAPSPPLSIVTLVRNSVIVLLELGRFHTAAARDHFLQNLRFLPNSTQLQQHLTLYFASLSPSAFQQHVTELQDHLTWQLTTTREINEATVGTLHLLSTLFSAYQLARTRSRLLVDEVSLFTNDAVMSGVDLYADYHFYFNNKFTCDTHVTEMRGFAFTRYCRFLYSTEVKSEMIRHWLDCHWINEMVQQAALPTQALTIHLSRQRLVPDLLNAIARTRMERGVIELRKPLHVVFSGEEGIDAGGLKKECLSGDHMVMTRSGWRSIVVIHHEFEHARLNGAASPVIEVSSFNLASSTMEWKRVTDTQRFPSAQRSSAGDRLFRMQGEGMDVVATGKHRMLVGAIQGRACKLSASSFGFTTVDKLTALTYAKEGNSALTEFEHQDRTVVVRCADNRQPDYKFSITGMENLCDWWWERDRQLGFLRFLGFWLGDGSLDVTTYRVCVTQRKLNSLAILIDLLDEVFPRWWYRNTSAPDANGTTFNCYIRCPPLVEWLRVMAIGPAGYNPLDPTQLRKYPHFAYDDEVARAEAASDYYRPRTRGSKWTEAAMLDAFGAGPVRRPCCVCSDARGVRLSCSGRHCHAVDATTRAHPACVGREDAEAFQRLQRVDQKNKSMPWPWFCPHPQCQLEAAQWSAAHPFIAPSTAASSSQAESATTGAAKEEAKEEHMSATSSLTKSKLQRHPRAAHPPPFTTDASPTTPASITRDSSTSSTPVSAASSVWSSSHWSPHRHDGRRRSASDPVLPLTSTATVQQNDAICIKCRKSACSRATGPIILCDGDDDGAPCPRGIHLHCVALDSFKRVPGKHTSWYCHWCEVGGVVCMTPPRLTSPVFFANNIDAAAWLMADGHGEDVPAANRRLVAEAEAETEDEPMHEGKYGDDEDERMGNEPAATIPPLDDPDSALQSSEEEADGKEDWEWEEEGKAPTTQAAGVQIVWNGGLWDIDADGHWFYRKRWLGPNVASSFANLSKSQAVALLEGFNRADGTEAFVQFDEDGNATGHWRCTNSSMPLIHHLQLIGQLAGARVDLSRHSKKDHQTKGPNGRTLTNKVDHWQLILRFDKVYGAQDVFASKLAKPVDVSDDLDARGNYQYEDDGYVYDISVDGNHNFLTQRLSLKRIGRARDGVVRRDVRAHPVYVGNCLGLASDSMFNAAYGMFVWSDETRTHWFNAHCQAHDSVDEMKGEYQLLGTVIGMALLNNVLLPNVLLPPVVYAKLLGLPLSFADLQSSFPQLHQSLSAILKYEGTECVEEVFGLTFSVDTEVMGATLSHPLLPNGEGIPVTAANRYEYVKLFTKYQLEDSIAVQFDAFARGFWSVLPRALLAPLLQPVDLELLVCGQREMDFRALEAATKYEGFPVRGRPNPHSAAYQAQLNLFAPAPVTAVKPNHPVIRHFWSIVHGLTQAQQKQLLHFVTGSASVPVKGLSEVKLVIANGGRDVRLLPSSRTCFSTLMLPLYKSEAELKKKLLISIEHNTGFGMK